MSRYIFAAAIAAMCIGMALVYAGVLGKGMIVPGAILIGAGMAIAALGGVVTVARGDGASRAGALAGGDAARPSTPPSAPETIIHP